MSLLLLTFIAILASCSPGGPPATAPDVTSTASEDSPPVVATRTPSPAVPTPTPSVAVTLAPTSGPCDATVQVTGEGLSPSIKTVRIGLARLAGSESPSHDLGGAEVDAEGRFQTHITFGATGCDVAGGLPPGSPPPAQPGQLGIVFYDATTGPPFFALGGLTRYTTTTREPAPERKDLRLPAWPSSWNRPLGT